MKRAVFPGTFDPITRGHYNIILKGLSLFDEIIIAIGTNSKKQHLFNLEKRLEWIRTAFEHEKKIKVATYTGLTVDFCKHIEAGFILRGLRNASDFEYEQSIAYANKEMQPGIETVFVLANPAFSTVSSTLVREIIIAGGDISRFVPENIQIHKPHS